VKKVFIILALLFLAAGPVPADAAGPSNPVDIKEWKVPFGGRSRDPYAESTNSVWFVGQGGNYLARLDPRSGKFTRKALDDEPGPHNLIVGADGIVWYAGNLDAYIGRFDPASGRLDKIAMPAEADDPHTLVFDQGEKHIWFTVQWGNFVGRLTLASRGVELIPVPTRRARPYGIIVAPDGTPWVALLGTDKLASVDPGTLKLTEHKIAAGARPRRLGATRGGRIYYTDYRRGYLGRLDPRSGKIDEWVLPSGRGSRPYAMAVDGRDRVWLVETGPSPNNFVGFDPARGAITSITPIPSGAGSVRHMHYHQGSGAIWFGTDEDTIGRALVGK
jgi:virginiamycin B lyase